MARSDTPRAPSRNGVYRRRSFDRVIRRRYTPPTITTVTSAAVSRVRGRTPSAAYVVVPAVLYTDRRYTFDGGTSGSTVTTSDTGSGDTFDAVSLGAGNTAEYSTTRLHGRLGFHGLTGGTNNTAALAWSNGLSTRRMSFRLYFRLEQVDSQMRVASFLDQTGTNLAATWRFVATTRVLGLTDSNNSLVSGSTFSTVPDLSTWYRLEGYIRQGFATNDGVWGASLYLGESTTALESVSGSAADFAGDTFVVERYRVGTVGLSTEFYFDSIAVVNNTTAGLGPLVTRTGRGRTRAGAVSSVVVAAAAVSRTRGRATSVGGRLVTGVAIARTRGFAWHAPTDLSTRYRYIDGADIELSPDGSDYTTGTLPYYEGWVYVVMFSHSANGAPANTTLTTTMGGSLASLGASTPGNVVMQIQRWTPTNAGTLTFQTAATATTLSYWILAFPNSLMPTGSTTFDSTSSQSTAGATLALSWANLSRGWADLRLGILARVNDGPFTTYSTFDAYEGAVNDTDAGNLDLSALFALAFKKSPSDSGTGTGVSGTWTGTSNTGYGKAYALSLNYGPLVMRLGSAAPRTRGRTQAVGTTILGGAAISRTRGRTQAVATDIELASAASRGRSTADAVATDIELASAASRGRSTADVVSLSIVPSSAVARTRGRTQVVSQRLATGAGAGRPRGRATSVAQVIKLSVGSGRPRGRAAAAALCIIYAGEGGGVTAPSYRSASTASADPSPTVSEPAGAVVGDQLVLGITTYVNDVDPQPVPSHTTPSGWTLAGSVTDQGDNGFIYWTMRFSVYRKAATSGSDSATITSDFGHSSAAMLAYQNADSIDVDGTFTTGDLTATGVTTTQVNDLLVYVGGVGAGSAADTFTPPSGMTERVDLDTAGGAAHARLTFADETIASPGATGTRTATSTNNAVSRLDAAALLAFKGVGGRAQTPGRTRGRVSSTATRIRSAASTGRGKTTADAVSTRLATGQAVSRPRARATASATVYRLAQATARPRARATASSYCIVVAGGGGYTLPTYRAASSATSPTISKPSGTQAGDILIAMAGNGGGISAPAITTPSGWTFLGSATGFVDDPDHLTYGVVRVNAYVRVAQAGDTSWTFTNALDTAILGYYGGNSGIPTGAFSSSNDTIVAPAIVTTNGNDILVTMYGVAYIHSGLLSGSFTAPSGMTERVEVGGTQQAFSVNDENRVSAGTTGTRSPTSAPDDTEGLGTPSAALSIEVNGAGVSGGQGRTRGRSAAAITTIIRNAASRGRARSTADASAYRIVMSSANLIPARAAEGETTTGWAAAWGAVEVSSEQALSPTTSLKATGDAGLHYEDISRLNVIDGSVLVASAWVYHTYGSPVSFLLFTQSHNLAHTPQVPPYYTRPLGGTAWSTVPSGVWTKLTTTFIRVTESADHLSLYVQDDGEATPGVTYYLDAVRLSASPIGAGSSRATAIGQVAVLESAVTRVRSRATADATVVGGASVVTGAAVARATSRVSSQASVTTFAATAARVRGSTAAIASRVIFSNAASRVRGSTATTAYLLRQAQTVGRAATRATAVSTRVVLSAAASRVRGSVDAVSTPIALGQVASRGRAYVDAVATRIATGAAAVSRSRGSTDAVGLNLALASTVARVRGSTAAIASRLVVASAVSRVRGSTASAAILIRWASAAARSRTASSAIATRVVLGAATSRTKGRVVAVAYKLAIAALSGRAWIRASSTSSVTSFGSAVSRVRSRSTALYATVGVETGQAISRAKSRATAAISAFTVSASAASRVRGSTAATGVPIRFAAAAGRVRSRSMALAQVVVLGTTAGRGRVRAAIATLVTATAQAVSRVHARATAAVTSLDSSPARSRTRGRATAASSAITTTAQATGRTSSRTAAVSRQILFSTAQGRVKSRATSSSYLVLNSTTASRVKGRGTASGLRVVLHSAASRSRPRQTVTAYRVCFATGSNRGRTWTTSQASKTTFGQATGRGYVHVDAEGRLVGEAAGSISRGTGRARSRASEDLLFDFMDLVPLGF